MTKPSIYLDYAAATPLDERVLVAMQPLFAANFYNPSATYTAALNTRKILEAARSQVAHWLGARPSEVIFTAGGTEANNLAVHGVLGEYPDANVVVSAVEHESVLVPAARHDCRHVVVAPDGRVDTASVREAIDDNTVLVSIMYANNEVGTIQPIRDIGLLLMDVRKQRRAKRNELPLYFHTDACQAANYLDLHVARLGVDLLTLNGGKIYGPKQSGVLYIKGGVRLQPLIDGGGQERALRSGTENIAGAVGLATALGLVQNQRQVEAHRLQGLQKDFLALLGTELPMAALNGSRKHRLPNNIHITLPGHDNERLLIQLDEAGVQAAAGSACSASAEEASHVLSAMGLDTAAARASLRFTMGRGTSSADIKKTVTALVQIARST